CASRCVDERHRDKNQEMVLAIRECGTRWSRSKWRRFVYKDLVSVSGNWRRTWVSSVSETCSPTAVEIRFSLRIGQEERSDVHKVEEFPDNDRAAYGPSRRV